MNLSNNEEIRELLIKQMQKNPQLKVEDVFSTSFEKIFAEIEKKLEKGKVIVHLTRALGINLAGVRLIFHFMEQLNVAPDNYVTYLSEVANALNITPEQQAIKKEQLSKRGRKPKNAKSN